jgi:beta-phosphoglucomutase-like phosphatase (HAD superfamily)
MSDSKIDVDSLLQQDVVYDGEGYTRDGLQHMLSEYQVQHKQNLTSLSELSKAHDDLAAEMTADLIEHKSAWDHLKNIATFNKMGSNFRGLLEKIPLLREAIPDREINDLLEEKIEVAQRRVQEIANYLDTMQTQVGALQTDITRLNKKMVVAAVNEEKAARFVLDLKGALEQVEANIAALGDETTADVRELQAKRDQIKQMIWREGSKLRLYSNAEDRIASIINMNNNFYEILTNLHGNMQTLYETGNEVLNELQGNLAGLATAAKAADLTMEMQVAMQSLKDSVNKVAVLASETSVYLSQNVDRLTSEMKIYDDETQRLVESNLQAEREMKEDRINETIELARTEYGHFERARADVPSGG